MKPIRAWQGVRLRRLARGPGPDAPSRLVTLPASWEEEAAAALAALASGTGATNLPVLAESWIRPINDRARQQGLPPMADALHGLLLRRQAAPTAGIWHNQPEAEPGFLLNLAAFHDACAGFDAAAFAAAAELAVEALTLAAPAATRLRIGITDFAGLLGCLGMEYASPAAQGVLTCILALLRARADTASARLAGLFGPAAASLSHAPLPGPCVLAILQQQAADAWQHRPQSGLRHTATTALHPPGPVDALLGAETGGIAPAFSPLTEHGQLSRTARAFLAARGLPAETALAALLAGEDILAPAATSAHDRLHALAEPYLQAMPARLATPAPGAPASPPLPDKRRGYTQRASVGGHALFLRTGEYQDGRLGEIGIAPARESAAYKALMEAFAQAVSIGLQHGVSLEQYVDAFVGTRFGAAGTVEGDPTVPRASSPLDYVFRHLAVAYLHRTDLPGVAAEEAAPLLPLELPHHRPAARPARAALRLVAG